MLNMFALINWGIELLIILVVVSSIMSWFRPDPRNPFVKLMNGIVDPLLHPIRAILPATGGLDFSPMVTILILWFLQKLLTGGIAH
jgi:YggT family protein